MSESYTIDNWNSKEGHEIRKCFNDYEKALNTVQKLIDYFEDYKTNPKLDDQKKNNIKKVDDYKEDAKQKISPLVNKMKQKISSFGVDLETRSNSINDEDAGPQANLLMQDLNQNQEFLDNRRKELENIHQTAANIKDTTDKMKQQINEQGAILNDIEVKVDETKKNAEKGKKEITEANEISKGNSKRLYCLLSLILIAVAGIVAIILYFVL